MFEFRQGDVLAMRRCCDEELALRRATGDRLGLARALNHMSRLLIDTGDLAGARACLEEGLALCRQPDLQVRPGTFINERGEAVQPQHDLYVGVGMFTNDLGEIARLEGNYDVAETWYLESMAVFRVVHGGRSLAWTLQNLGYVARQRGAYAQARAYFDEALQLFDDVGAPLGVAACLAGLAYVAASRAQAETAALLLGASEALRLSIGAQYQAPERIEVERGRAAARAALPAGEFEALWGAGQRMSVGDALELARRP